MSKSEPIDRQAFLERVGGDTQLAHMLVGVLLDSLPKLKAAVTEAAQGQQANALERSAHALKGALSTFSAAGATEAAGRLESMGRAGEAGLGDSAQCLAVLSAELRTLESYLRANFKQTHP